MSDPVDDQGILIKISNQASGHFTNNLVAVEARHPEGPSLRWILPARLMGRMDVCAAVGEEVHNELNERAALIREKAMTIAQLRGELGIEVPGDLEEKDED